MLRKGMGESSVQLAQHADIEALVDVEVFGQCRKIEQALLSQSVTECLAWWNENKIALSKINVSHITHYNSILITQSNLEFELRQQEYIELVRKGEALQAIAYYRKYLVPFEKTHREAIERAATLLAFSPDTQVQPYKVRNCRICF